MEAFAAGRGWTAVAWDRWNTGGDDPLGINEKGMTLLWFQFEGPFSTRWFTPAAFYRMLFASLGVGIWLTVMSSAVWSQLSLWDTPSVFGLSPP